RLLMTNDSFRSSGFAAYCERLGAGDALDRAFRAGGTLANCYPQLAQGCGSLAAQRSGASASTRADNATRDQWRLAPEPSVAGGRKPVWRVKYSLARHLPRCDSDLHGSVRPEMIAGRSMMLGVPMANASLYLTEEVEAAFFGQVSEVANEVCDRMLVAR